MANVLSLAMKINADASGFKLDPVQRALKALGDEITKVSSVFDKFTGTSDAAAKAQAETTRQLETLTAARKAGTISAEEFASQFELITDAAKQQAAVFEEGARVTEANRTAEERRATQLQRLDTLLQQGAIGQDTYNRAVAQASGANEAAAEAERQLATQKQAASRIIEANLTSLERAQRAYDAAIRETQQLEQAGLLTAAQANTERQRQAQILQKVTTETERASAAAKRQTLQFNELSGIFAVLPGPLGNIAGRVSGITSASEGLSRIFAGGLRQGISSVAASLTSLINPLTIAVAGVAAFGAAAAAIVNGLIALEDRVEKLGNTADKLGVSFQFVQTLDEAARRSGTSIEAVSAAFGRLQRSVLGVDEESKAAQKALEGIGVTAEEIQRLKPEEQYQLIGQRIAEIEDPARRTATATALFGRAGADLVPFFNNIRGAADDISRFGNALSDTQRRDIDAFGASMDRLGVATTSAKEQLLAEFAPAATQTANTFASAAGVVARNKEVFASGISAVVNNLFGNLPAAISLLNTAVATFDDGATAADEATKNVQKNVELTAEQVVALQKAFEASNRSLDVAINKAGEYGQAGFNAALQFQNAIKDLQDQVADNELTAEQYSRGVANATVEYERQIELARQVSEENRRLAEEANRRAEAEAAAVQKIIDANLEQIRIESEFGGDASRARNADDLVKIREEIAKTEQQIAEANARSDEKAAARASARLAQLDQVEAKLAEAEAAFADRADQTAQGFADGFDKAFAATTRGLDSIIDKASQLGNEGAKAAQQLQEGITRAQEQVRAGILSQPAYEAEVLAQRKLAEERLAQIDRENAARQEQVAAEFQIKVAANERLNEFMMRLDGGRFRAEAAAAEESASRRKQAIENLEAIENRIATQRKSIEAAREQNDLRAAKARREELAALEKIQRQERAIADGKVVANREINNVAQSNAAAQQRQLQDFNDAAQRQISATRNAANNAIELTNEAFAKAADRQRKLFDQLNTLGSRTINVADARTQEGAALVLGLAANAQDPRLIEQRLANRLLREISVGLTQNLNRIGIGATLL